MVDNEDKMQHLEQLNHNSEEEDKQDTKHGQLYKDSMINGKMQQVLNRQQIFN